MAKEKNITKKDDDWMSKKWRPMMAIMYMAVCIFDFIAFPIMFTIVQFWEVSAANDAFRQWNPITLLGGGLFHVAMGAVLGVSAWSRGQEKIAGVATNSSPTIGLPAPAPAAPISFGAPSSTFGATSTAYNQPPSWGTTQVAMAPVTTGFGGKLAPPEPDFYPER